MALLVVLWQGLCLCHAEGGDGGHAHCGPGHAIDGPEDHHPSDAPGSHDLAQGDHNEHGKDAPCDDHGDGCDCSKSFANTQKAPETGQSSLGLSYAAALWLPVTLVEPRFLSRHGLRGVPREGLPPPPLLKLHRVLLI